MCKNFYLIYWKDLTKIVDHFVGQLKSTFKGYYSVNFDPTWLPILQDLDCQCLELFTEEETLQDNENPTCLQFKNSLSH